jgi:hypothetical protein
MWSLLIIVMTVILFVTALFAKRFTHDLLLEAGVFLVSVKLILLAHKSSVASATMQQKLDEIISAVQRREA